MNAIDGLPFGMFCDSRKCLLALIIAGSAESSQRHAFAQAEIIQAAGNMPVLIDSGFRRGHATGRRAVAQGPQARNGAARLRASFIRRASSAG
jgi:hypothetical protein